jgi:putative ABC transport system substrate-binding protein
VITRRHLLVGLAASAAAADAESAASAPKVIGVLNPYFPDEAVRANLDRFDRAMLERGYVKGTHYVVVERMAKGRDELLRPMAEELVRMKVDLIYAAPSNAVAEAQRATATIPIVFVAVGDPVGGGFAETLAHPGHNITGVTNNAGDLSPKRFEFLKQLLPDLSRLTLLATPKTPTYPAFLPQFRARAQALGWTAGLVEAALPLDLERVFASILEQRPHALYVAGDAYLWNARRPLADLALRHKLPTIFPFVEHVEAGGLMSYGADQQDWWRQSADLVDKVFKGASPGDLPIEQPTKIDLVINRRTAEALRLKLPLELLVQAARVID